MIFPSTTEGLILVKIQIHIQIPELFVILSHWEIGPKLYIAQYLKRLQMDYDKTWWTGWMCDENESIRFWWRFRSGSKYQIFFLILFIIIIFF